MIRCNPQGAGRVIFYKLDSFLKWPNHPLVLRIRRNPRGHQMVKLFGGARALAVLVAIAAAFVTVPQVAVILLVLGAIAGLGNSAEDNMRVMVIAIVLLVGSKSLEAIPTVGTYLATIFGG